MLHLVEPPALPTSMRAARLSARGGPESMRIERAPLPALQDGDVLVRVSAAAITPSELGWEPTWTHPDGTSRTPVVPSHEVAGIVIRGAGEIDWSSGSAVFGLADFYRDGGAAEYIAMQAADLAEWPAGIGAAMIAALPLSGLTAWQALFDHGHLLAGERVLVHGAAGGVGNYAVQLAKVGGATVSGVAAERDMEFVRGLGVDDVVDRADAFDSLAGGVPFDLIIDTVGGEVLARSWALLAPAGRLVSIAPSSRAIADDDSRGHFFVVEADRGELDELSRLVAAGDLRVTVERTFPLEAAREAYEFAQQAHPRGKVVLEVADGI